MYEDYKVVTATSVSEVTKKVIKQMEEYWEPIGGLCYDGVNYHQVLALPIEEEA